MQNDWRVEVLVAANKNNMGVLRHNAEYEAMWHSIRGKSWIVKFTNTTGSGQLQVLPS
jgi:hypothetical protein